VITTAIIGGVRDRLHIEDHAALVGTGVAVGLALLSLTLVGNNASDTAALAATMLACTIVLWIAAKYARYGGR
jgi:uncharacterized membrane protein